VADHPTFLVSPSGYRNSAGEWVAAADPIGSAIRSSPGGCLLDLIPGGFPRAKGPFGARNIRVRGWDRSFGVSTILRDDTVGSSDNFIMGDGDTNFVLERLNIELDDRAGVKTTSSVGPKIALIDVMMYGKGSPHDPLWKDSAKWGCHTYNVASWNEIRVAKWSIYGEHGAYVHNQQGAVNYEGGGGGYLGGCDIFHASRMNEGPVGKGDVVIHGRVTREVCVVQGGSAFTFRGGVPDGKVTIANSVGRLGCDPNLAAPFNENICGMLSVDAADETAPGKVDAAWPGKYREIALQGCDWTVGTIWPGRPGMIRPVATIGNARLFTMHNTNIKVFRAPGAYPIGLAIKEDCDEVQITGDSYVDGWVDFKGDKFHSWETFKMTHPECFS
jgi:hypothetical protein